MIDSSQPRVGVVIPCRDRADTVAEAVLSVLDQDYSNLEVIAVDDGSTDSTVNVLRGIRDPRLRILSNFGTRGPSAARNFGVRHTTAPWIAFQDSDDLWRPARLSRQMPRLASGSWIGGFCGMEVKLGSQIDSPVIDRYPRPGTAPRSSRVLPDLLRNSIVSTQMLILRRDVFELVGGFDETLSALVDWELMLRVAPEGPIDFLAENLVVQRLSPNSITWMSARRVAAQQQVLEKHRDLFATDPKALARHHHRIAGSLRTLGKWHAARAHSAAAMRLFPTRPRYVAAYAWSFLGSIGPSR
ncbi:MAG: glycosyltransferase [Henriciella sp.]|uniref:glycosyltransferase family 2 protein n=1 Tax=Henriciella sp. TaxID=1968823 RepID=UPI003C76338E